MSGKPRRPYNNRGRGRGHTNSSNRGGNHAGAMGNAPVFQPQQNPPPPVYKNPPPPAAEGRTRREETITTTIEGGKTVTTKTVTITKEPSKEQGNISPNIAFQPNAPPIRYPPTPSTPGYTVPPPISYPHQPGNFVPRGAMPRPNRPISHGNYSGYEPGYQENTFRPQNPQPEPLMGGFQPPSNRRGTRRPPSSGRYRGQGTRGAFSRTGNDNRSESLNDTATGGPDSHSNRDKRSGQDVSNNEATQNVKTKQKRSQKLKSPRNDETSDNIEEVSTGIDDITLNTNDSIDNSDTRDKVVKQSKRRNKKKSDKIVDDSEVPKAEETSSKLDLNRKTSETDDDLSQGPWFQTVFDYMVKEMNGKGSPAEISRKSGLFPVTFDKDMIENWFKSRIGKFKSIVRNGHVECVFVYQGQMNYCLDYISKRSCKKDKCTRYHVCKDMLCGNCMYGDDCNKSHDFFDDTQENLSISKGIRITDKYTNEQVLSIMQCRYPHVCHDWNQKKGCRLVNCENLHICDSFMLGKCQNGDDCSYGHDRMSTHNRPIVEAYEMTSWNDEHFRRIIYIKRGVVSKERVEANVAEDSADPTEKTDKDRNKTDIGVELCEKYLLDNCKTPKCRLYHNVDLRLPYIWQVKVWDNWINISQSEAVEKEFCAFQDKSEPLYVNDLESDRSELVQITFQPTISARIPDSRTPLEARRLSTRSYISKGPMSFRTQWRWYYIDDTGEEQIYSPDDLQHSLEMKYLFGQTEYTFMKEGFPHINFSSMSLVNDGGYTTIFRRPLLVTRDDVDERSVPASPNSVVEIKVPLPRDWAPWDVANTAELINLAKTSDEYAKVDDKFFERLDRGRLHIQGVFRVQNSEQWSQFASKEASMLNAVKRAQKAKDKVDKRYMFHGTDNFAAVKGICRTNLDPRVSGKNATHFGQGTYFAAEARLAHQYTIAPDRYVFMVNVLVGDFTKGESGYRKPPEKPDTDGEFYDSCVDDEKHPMKFVVFDSNQYYPEYLIWYRDADEDDSPQ